jgi:hypothetical protein
MSWFARLANLRSPATMIALGGFCRKSLFASLKAIFFDIHPASTKAKRVADLYA